MEGGQNKVYNNNRFDGVWIGGKQPNYNVEQDKRKPPWRLF